VADHRDDTRFKWTLLAVVGLVALTMILGTIQELVG
jgi:hypothetical protein